MGAGKTYIFVGGTKGIILSHCNLFVITLFQALQDMVDTNNYEHNRIPKPTDRTSYNFTLHVAYEIYSDNFLPPYPCDAS